MKALRLIAAVVTLLTLESFTMAQATKTFASLDTVKLQITQSFTQGLKDSLPKYFAAKTDTASFAALQSVVTAAQVKAKQDSSTFRQVFQPTASMAGYATTANLAAVQAQIPTGTAQLQNTARFIDSNAMAGYVLKDTLSAFATQLTNTYQPKGSYLTSLTTSLVTGALGYTPYNATANPLGFLTSVPAQSYASLTGKPTLSTVATSGNYNDLINLPTIPSTANLVKVTDTAAMLAPYARTTALANYLTTAAAANTYAAKPTIITYIFSGIALQDTYNVTFANPGYVPSFITVMNMSNGISTVAQYTNITSTGFSVKFSAVPPVGTANNTVKFKIEP